LSEAYLISQIKTTTNSGWRENLQCQKLSAVDS